MQLTDEITSHFRLNDFQKKALARLGLLTVRDLLYHFPSRYADMGSAKRIAEIEKDEKVVLYGTLDSLQTKKTWKTKVPSSKGKLTDETGSIEIIWFHQPYLAKMIPAGSLVKVEGKVGEYNGKLSMTNPEVERVADIPADGDSLLGNDNDTANFFPVYKESRGITSRWFYYAIQKVFATGVHEELEDPLDAALLKKYNLPTLTSAIVWIHTPKKVKDARAARKRFAFEEVLIIQLKKRQERKENESKPSFEIAPTKETLDTFVSRFPFTPTDSQQKAVEEIVDDISTPHAMSRLLEGDVGSGKTFVAAVTAYAVVSTRPKNKDGDKQDFGALQVAYMAPTEILATQLYESFIEFFEGTHMKIGLITSSGCKKFPSKVSPDTWTDISRTQLLKWVKNGEIPILIGTHSLIQKTVEFKHLAYVIIDEQHRFGTMQRGRLAKKGDILPHLLSMTATPIPRTLALTVYGDLDLTLLEQMPHGRKPVITEIVPPDERDDIYEEIRERVKSGKQAYVICPRINEPDEKKANALRLKSVKEETKRLQKDVFPEFSIDMLHGGQTSKVKDEMMKRFESKEIDILVATSVVEVGVNVPNATTIIIEGAERFGLAQLHQLRGRVQRSSDQAYCYIFPDTKNEKSLERLQALQKAPNGFALAEYDLEFRGAGELYGKKQWGITDIGMEAIKNIKMVESARNEAKEMIDADPTLEKSPKIKALVAERETMHLE